MLHFLLKFNFLYNYFKIKYNMLNYHAEFQELNSSKTWLMALKSGISPALSSTSA